MKTDSPIPGQLSEALTPTTKSTAIKLKRLSRNRTSLLAVKSSENEDAETVGMSEDTQSSTTSENPANLVKTPNTRTKRQVVKESKDEESNVGAGRKARVVEDKVTEEEPEEEELEVEEEEEDEEELEEDDDVEEEESGEIEGEEAELDEKIEKESSTPEIIIKQEKLDSKNISITSAADLSGVRRSTRARKSTNKDRDSSITSKKKESPEIKKEKFDSKAEPIVIDVKEDKLSSNAISITVEATEASEKDASLSPSLVSEELDTMSVQHLYDKPHFLENNLGIEQDPKLGDIVKVQEKTKIADATDKEDVEMKDASKEIKAKASDDVIASEKMDEDDTEKESASESADECSTKSQATTKVVKEVEKQIVAKKVELIVPKEKSSESKDNKVVVKVVAEPKDIAKEEITIEKVKESIKTVKKLKQPEVVKEATQEKPKEVVKVLKKSSKTGDAEEPTKATIKVEKLDDEVSKEESSEENKENNDASGNTSVGSNSPRSEEDCLKLVGEDNIVKVESNEDKELLLLKELHFKSLGLLTHKAADAANLETKKRNEEYSKNNIGTTTTSTSYGRKSKNSSSDQGYTGTLKTVIKLHRPREEKRKTRMPLKMTFQKKSRADRDSNGSANSAENSFYTIHNDKDVSASSESHGGISRKNHNRSYNHDNNLAPSIEQTNKNEPVVKDNIELTLVIPEKASSFKVHPERICKDQCFYCGGKFGLYDTPCHIAQIKSSDRQNKILQSEEKLTLDSCLCDACFRHVDRRANCPSYKKRLSAPPNLQQTNDRYQQMEQSRPQQPGNFDRTYGCCNVTDCTESAVHNIRKKWLMKMKKSILKVFQINLDSQPNNNIANVSICEKHYAALSHLMVCAMCKRRLPRNHIFYITQDVPRLEHLISEQGMNIKLTNSTLVVCKLCRYYANLLIKPPEPKTQKADFVKNYTKKLLHHNNLDSTEYDRRNMAPVTVDDDDDVEEVPIRSENLTLTIKNGKIQPKKHNTQNRFYNNAKNSEVTITRSPAAGGHILLDNEVMVGYDMPIMDCPSPPASVIKNPNYKGPPQQAPPKSVYATKPQVLTQKQRKDENSDMARALKANPNISMRELFPGEEEMGLQINIPFSSNNNQRTPEGWIKVQTTMQYDDTTRSMWEELQRPYGNQSSFLRHLILLEKYYRNGDLVLSQSASNSAITYSNSVHNRIRSYDNIPTNNNAFNNEISIIPASKMKSKQNEALTITPQPGGSMLKRKASQPEVQIKESPKNKVSKLDDATPKKTHPPPPELISLGAKRRSNDQNATEKESTASPPMPSFNLAQSITITPTTSSSSTTQSGSTSGNIVVLPETLSTSERKTTAKAWRPTLIPITTGSSALLNAGGQLYQTADGRKLPALVQVMSGGKPYHISIRDYNRMCILRREKLQQQYCNKQRQQNATQAGGSSTEKIINQNINNNQNSLSITSIPKNNSNNNHGFKNPAPPSNSTTNTSPNYPRSTGNKQLVNIPNQILEQNSLIPLNNDSNGKHHNNHRNANGQMNFTSVQTAVNFHNQTKHLNLPNSTSLLSGSAAVIAAMMPGSALSSLAKSVNALQPSTSNASHVAHVAQMHANSLWNIWNENDVNSESLSTLASIANMNPNVGGSTLMDNVAATLLSKIPKSLTVTPQQKNNNHHDQRSHTEYRQQQQHKNNNSAST
ncbi:unnamed protein product [Diamesa serratosioi]